MRTLIDRTLPILLSAILAALLSGCSAKAQKADYLARADKYFGAGKYPEAEIEYLNVLKVDPENAEAWSRLSTIYYEEGRIMRAYQFITRALELNPNDTDLQIKAGMIYLTGGDRTNATKQAIAVLDHSPTNAEAPLLMVESMTKREQAEDIRQRLENLRQKIGDSATIEAAFGTLYYRTGDTNSGDAALKKALSLDAKSIPALSAMGTLYWLRNDLTNADRSLKTAADLSPLRSSRRLRYADFKLQTGDVTTARQILTNITQQVPDYVPAWTKLAEIAFAQKDYTNCAALVKQALSHEADDLDARLLSARVKLAEHETDKAIAELEGINSMYTRGMPQAFYQLAVAYVMKDDVANAIKNVNQAVQLNPDYADAILLQAQLNIRRDNGDSAIASLNNLVTRQPGIVQAYVLLVSAYSGRDDLDNALINCRKLAVLAPKNPQVPFLTGLVYLQQKKPDEARKQFEASMELAPDFVPAFEQIINIDLNQKAYEPALKKIQAKEEQYPKSPIIQALLARAYAAQTNSASAEAALLKAIDLDANYEPAYLMLANLYVSTKQNAKALEKLNQTLAKNPRDTGALLLTGMILNEQQDYGAARDAYEKLIAINPNSYRALNNLAYLYSEKLNSLDKAYDAARKAHDIAPNDWATTDTLGWILFKRKEYSFALNFLQGSAENLPQEPEVQYHLGMTYYMMNDEQRAKGALTRAISLSNDAKKDFPGKADAEQRLIVLNLNASSADAAVRQQLEKRIAEQPDDVIALFKLATVYQRDGQAEKAAQTLQNVLQKNPQNAAVMSQLANLYNDQLHDSTRALDLAKNAYKLAPDDPSVAFLLGRLAYANGDFRYALNLLQQTDQKQPRDPEVLFYLGNAYYSVGRIADAEAALQNALGANPGFPHAAQSKRFLDLVHASDTPEKAAEAESTAKGILSNDPTNVPALMIVAGASEKRADTPGAIANYQKVLQRYPDFLPAMRRLVALTPASSATNQAFYDMAMKARQAYPSDPDVARALGILYYNRADYSSAARLLNESIKTGKADGVSLFYLGMAHFQLKETKESKDALQRAITTELPDELAEQARKTLAQQQ